VDIVFTVGFGLLVLAFVADTDPESTVTGQAVFLAFFVLILVAVWLRGRQTGVYVSGYGVRIIDNRGIQRTVRWASISGFDSRRAEGSGMQLGWQAIWIERAREPALQTMVRHRLEEPPFGVVEQGVVLTEEEYQRVLEELRQALGSARKN
jgi:hypothetical protein